MAPADRKESTSTPPKSDGGASSSNKGASPSPAPAPAKKGKVKKVVEEEDPLALAKAAAALGGQQGKKKPGMRDPGPQFPKGDYQIQVTVHEGRELHGRDRTGTSDPFCAVETMDKKEQTEAKKANSNPVWNQFMVLEFQNCTQADLEYAKVNLSVYDANKLMRNVLIGSAELDVAYIFKQKGHEVYKQWLALTDVTDENEGVQGYLKVSIAVLGPGMEPVSHDPSSEPDPADEDPASMVLMPPRIKQEYHMLCIRCHLAEGLPKVDKFGSCDAFIKVKYAGNPAVQTEVISSLNPIWNEQLQIPVARPVMTDRIELQIWDYNRFSSNQLLATAFFRYSQVDQGYELTQEEMDEDAPIVPPSHATPKWLNMYGAPVNKDNDVAKKMNLARAEGSEYRGRILLTLWDVPYADPALGKSDFEAEPGLIADLMTEEYTLRFGLWEAVELPMDKKCHVEVAVGPHVIKSASKSAEDGVIKWYESFKEHTFKFPMYTHQVPDVFVYLVMDGKRVAYLRYTLADLAGKYNQEPDWHLFKEEKSLDLIEEGDVPGYALFSLVFGPSSEVAKKCPEKMLVAKPKKQKYTLYAHFYQGRDLPAADDDGSLDPYLVLKLGGKKIQLPTLHKTTCPQWYKTYSFEVELAENLILSPEIIVQAYDWDKFGGDDFIGRFTVPAEDTTVDFVEPKWYPLYWEDPADTDGEILASFQLVPRRDAPRVKVPKDLSVPSDDAVMEITVLGVRDLQPYSMMSVNSPFIEFDLGTRDSKDKVFRTKASNTPSGPAANHLEVIKIPFKMPKNGLYTPSVNMRVFDYRNNGMSTPLVGSACIDLKNLLKTELSGRQLQTDGADLDFENAEYAELRAEEEKKRKAKKEATHRKAMENMGQDIEMQPLDDDGKKKKSREGGEKDGKGAKGKGKGKDASKEEKELTASEAKKKEDEEKKKKDKKAAKKIDFTPEYMKGRKIIDNELEDTFETPAFHDFAIFRGQKRGLSQADLEDPDKAYRQVGKIKGFVRVLIEGQKQEPTPFKLEELLNPQAYVVRAYVLRGINLMPKDSDGFSDPYVTLKLGEQEIDDEEHKIEHTLNPTFHKMYEMKALLPGTSTLEINVNDYDMIGTNDNIGTTKIDLENRWFDDEWRAHEKKPLEKRTLWNPSSSNPQGKIAMWVDIMTPLEAKRQKPVDISLPDPVEHEIRIVVWGTRKVTSMDTITDQNDMYITGSVTESDGKVTKQSTDIHWRCKKGKGSFNYRLKFPIMLPQDDVRLGFEAWDQDIIAANDSIGSMQLSLTRLCKQAFFSKQPQYWIEKGDKTDYSKKDKNGQQQLPKQWVEIRNPNFPEAGSQGEIQVSVEILSKEHAKMKPAGSGRSAPNANPLLPPPTRIKFNLFRPDLMLKELLGPELCYKFKGVIICVCCLTVGGFVAAFLGQAAAFSTLF